MNLGRMSALLLLLILLGGETISAGPAGLAELPEEPALQRADLPAQLDQAKQANEFGKIEVGMLDPANPGGLVLVTGRTDRPGAGFFGIRLHAYRPQERIEEASFVLDGSSSTLTWQTGFDSVTPVTLRWTHLQPATLGLLITGPPSIHLLLELYEPFANQRRGTDPGRHVPRAGFLAATDGQTLRGEQIQSGTVVLPRPSLVVRSEQVAAGAASYRDRTAFHRDLLRRGQAANLETEGLTGRYHFAALSYDLGRQKQLALVVALGNQWERLDREVKTILERPLVEQIRAADEAARRRLPLGSGSIAASVERLNHFLAFARRFDPVGEQSHLVNAAPRPAAGERRAEVNVETLLLAALGAPFNASISSSTLRHLLSAQLSDGRIPASWRAGSSGEADHTAGRSMLPLGALATLRIYRATNDLELLGWAFPRLLLWNDWWLNNRGDGRRWRDGNRDGLPEWGYNEELELGRLGAEQLSPAIRRRLALSEGMQLERPGALFNAETATLEENSIALSSLLALDLECLAVMARELGLTAEAERLEGRHAELRRLINSRLWDEDSGSYVDRRWNGQPVRQLTVENYLPLLAGLPDQQRLKQIMTSYNQSSLLPAAGSPPGPLLYLLYLGLRRYGRHAESAALASAWREMARDHQASPLPDGPAIEEIFSLDPLTGLSFGSVAANRGTNSIERVQVGKQLLNFFLSPTQTTVQRDGMTELEGAGAARLHGYRQQTSLLSFSIESAEPIQLRIPGEKGRKVTVSVDNNILGSTSIGATASFRVPAGTHRILAVK
ncbi:MAG: hypothetical protein RIR86_277 [Acidobacteriota bacterium]